MVGRVLAFVVMFGGVALLYNYWQLPGPLVDDLLKVNADVCQLIDNGVRDMLGSHDPFVPEFCYVFTRLHQSPQPMVPLSDRITIPPKWDGPTKVTP